MRWTSPTKNFFCAVLFGFAIFCVSPATSQQAAGPTTAPTFYRDVLPILQEHCQVCHRAGGIAPMAFETYESTRSYAPAIREATRNRSMPPWFAEKGIGKFSNDPSLNGEEIELLARPWSGA